MLEQQIKEKISSLFDSGVITRALLWTNGEFPYEKTPYVANSKEELDDMSYDEFCAGSLLKYLITESKKEGKILVLLKPCDVYSYNRLVSEHRINADNVYLLGIACNGKADIEKIRESGLKGITGIEIDKDTLTVKTLYGDKELKFADNVLTKCNFCKTREFPENIETIGTSEPLSFAKEDDFSDVSKIESMTPEERFNFWRHELSKCIRCNACRNICPSCTCETCVFDNPASGISSKANADDFEENMFHIIRAFHVAGRCTDCRECSRVCPQNIPLYLLNRKFIKDINELYGDYQAGKTEENRSPLTTFTKSDAEPSVVYERNGGENNA